MAIMNKMREKMTVIFAGLAGAFLLMIIFEWGAQGDFFKSSRKPDEIGKVNGMPITNKDYEDMIQQMRQQKLQEEKKTTLTETEENDIRDKAWDQTVIAKILEQKMQEYGVVITDQEVRDVLFYNPPEFLKREFTDSLGRFNEAAYFSALRDPHNDTTVSKLTTQMREELKKQKLSGILQTTMRVTRSEMWERYNNTNAKATVQIIRLKPNGNPKDLYAKVTEDEVKKYYEDHPFLYKRDEGRKMKFVVFRELPSPKDSAMLQDRIEALKKKWSSMPVNAPDSAVEDLARDYTDLPYQPSIMMPPAMMNQFGNGDEVFNTKVGDVVTTTQQGQIKIMRILEQQDTGEVYYHLKNILIPFGTPPNKDSAKVIAQKVYNDIKAGGDFAAAAKQYSMDPSARKGGDMGWFKKGIYIAQVEEAAMKATIGEILGPIESPVGYHIIQVTGRSNKNLKIASIPIAPHSSQTTQKMVQQQANIFREKATKDGFDQAATAQNLRIQSDVPPVTKKAQPLFGYPPFTNYLFELSAGDITTPVRIPSGKLIVVAQVTEVQSEGVKPLDSLMIDQIKYAVAKRKMVEALLPKAKQIRAMLSPGDDLGKLSATDTSVKPFVVTMGPAESTGGLGTEYAVNNAAFGMKPGDISQPIEGDAGYYIIKLLDMKPADKKAYDAQKTKEFQTLSQEKQQRLFGQWIQNLKDKAEVIDYRSHRM
jgi:peptidyl-prolyl cis-trans isomerase D